MQFLQFQLADFNSGAGIPFGKCTVYLAGTSTLASLFDAGGSPISNPVIASSVAQAGFSAADGFYDFQPGNADGTPNGPKILKQQMFDLSNVAAPTAATRTALAALTATNGMVRYLSEAGREGWFVFSSANLSALVSADTQQGLYVAPASATSGASGAWVRKFTGPMSVTWFGAVADDNGTVGTNNFNAINGALAIRNALAIDNDGFVRGTGGIFVPAGRFYCGTALDFNFGTIFEGEGTPGHAPATQIRFPDSTSCLRLQYTTTSGETTTGVTAHSYGDHTIIRRIGIIGPLRGTEAGITGGEAEYHAILAKAPYILEDVYINGVRGDGVHCDADTGAGTGNINVSQINRLRVTNVRNGVLFKSGDANACTTIGVNGTYCRRHTIRDESFLGNTHIGCHSANAGLVPGVAASVVSYLGNRFYVKLGQATGASTNAPPSTATSNTYWGYISAGGASAPNNIPTWVSGVSVREGGGFFANNGNARNTFVGAYQEGGEATSQFVTPTLSLGGIEVPDTTGNVVAGSYANLPNSPVLGKTVVADISGGATAAASTSLLKIHNTTALASTVFCKMEFAHGYETDGITPCALASISAYGLSGVPSTTAGQLVFATRKYSTGVMTELAVFEQSNDAFRPWTDNFLLFGVSGTRWKTGYFYTLDATTSITTAGAVTAAGSITSSGATAGIGYATGAGGTVTQATSRTTGVTINKACGNITLVSAAGSASWQTFTVTNSAVGANDTIRVVQKSGTDLYQIHVTNVAAGSFKISFATTGGTTTEQPVFNFAVLKGVAA